MPRGGPWYSGGIRLRLRTTLSLRRESTEAQVGNEKFSVSTTMFTTTISAPLQPLVGIPHGSSRTEMEAHLQPATCF